MFSLINYKLSSISFADVWYTKLKYTYDKRQRLTVGTYTNIAFNFAYK